MGVLEENVCFGRNEFCIVNDEVVVGRGGESSDWKGFLNECWSDSCVSFVSVER